MSEETELTSNEIDKIEVSFWEFGSLTTLARRGMEAEDEIKRLREALEECVDALERGDPMEGSRNGLALEAARKALAGKEGA